jgi:hypothetical protein
MYRSRKHWFKLLYFLFVAFLIVNIVQHRVVLLRGIYFREVSPNIYVSKGMPSNLNMNVINIVDRALQRSDLFFQGKTNSIDCYIPFEGIMLRCDLCHIYYSSAYVSLPFRRIANRRTTIDQVKIDPLSASP